ncbi:alkaline shock response membrane anchor protein AmaP [Candidatus Omnitrophota bacterium]
MRFFTTFGILFYTLILCVVGVVAVGFALNFFPLNDLVSVLDIGYNDINIRMIIGLFGVLLILISLSFAQVILGRMQKEKTIAFNNPSGQVTVSLSAVEDLVRKLTAPISEIKELRPNVVVSKKGIQIILRVILRTETNIPDLTLRLQELVKSKVQEILGVDETITVFVHISKIIPYEIKETKSRKKKEPEETEEEPTVPFQNYGRT